VDELLSVAYAFSALGCSFDVSKGIWPVTVEVLLENVQKCVFDVWPNL